MTNEWWEEWWKVIMKDFHKDGHWLVQAHITRIPLSDSLKNELEWMNAEAKIQRHHPVVKRFALDGTWKKESSINTENKGNSMTTDTKKTSVHQTDPVKFADSLA
eukprot:CAMPEP_0114521840 /NCGR_PEP_ID=MMETSP0109-20121206/20410_1 /TAXON_ID=29199 /ORGANISM="Chlorarachnion reptans, Strain CCCM449" /LENGTH=104 /DNA_ID=CAMNT_0001702991 /DNA_START=20 /DNA_END=330 /DNA_ORIENTATION=+